MTHHCSPTRLAALRAARAFTLLEAMMVIIIIALLSGLVLVGARRAIDSGRREAERQVLISLKQAITNFQNEFRFLPPLVYDNNSSYPEAPGPYPPLPGIAAGPVGVSPDYNSLQPSVVTGLSNQANRALHDAFLQGFQNANPTSARLTADYRFSIHSLPYYVMGLLDTPGVGGNPIDGAAGPRFTAPRADGSFTGRGKAYDAMYDPSTQLKRLSGAGSPGAAFNDRWGRAIRYYRWEPRPGSATATLGSVESRVQTLPPRAAGDPRVNTKIRGARYALVITGEDRETDMQSPLSIDDTGAPMPSMSDRVKDDIVEVEE